MSFITIISQQIPKQANFQAYPQWILCSRRSHAHTRRVPCGQSALRVTELGNITNCANCRVRSGSERTNPQLGAFDPSRDRLGCHLLRSLIFFHRVELHPTKIKTNKNRREIPPVSSLLLILHLLGQEPRAFAQRLVIERQQSMMLFRQVLAQRLLHRFQRQQRHVSQQRA